jgi:hypothetical protein
MALYKVTAETDVSGDGAFKVYGGANSERAEVSAAEGFGGNADFEAVVVEGSDGETGPWGFVSSVSVRDEWG